MAVGKRYHLHWSYQYLALINKSSNYNCPLILQPTGEESEDEEATVASDIGEDLEVQSQSSLWEKLEPPVRKSPLPLNSARIIRSDSPQQDSQVDSSQRVSPRLEVPGKDSYSPWWRFHVSSKYL